MKQFNNDYKGCKPIKTIDLWVPVADKKIKVLSPAGVLYLNESAARIWQKIDGETSVMEITNQLCSEFSEISSDDMYDDVVYMLRLLEKYELVVIDGEPL